MQGIKGDDWDFVLFRECAKSVLVVIIAVVFRIGLGHAAEVHELGCVLEKGALGQRELCNFATAEPEVVFNGKLVISQAVEDGLIFSALSL